MKETLNPTTTTPETANTDNTRLSLLNSSLPDCIAFRAFKNTAAALGAPLENDSDLDRLEMAAAAFFGVPFAVEELDATYASHKTFSWTFWTNLLSSGRLNWWKEVEADTAPVVEPPVADDGRYFPDETVDPFDEGGDL